MNRPILLTMICLVLMTGFLSCESELDKYYEVPSWLKGNALELLQSDGNYSLFLEAVKKSGYEDVISGKGIITVMAPSNDAMKAYLEENGYADVSSIPDAEVKKLVGFHLIYYAFDKEKFANYRPEGVTTNTDYSDAGLYYKFRTKSGSGLETYIDPTTETGEDSVRLVYHKERFIPVLSSYLFATKGIDAASNYQYFYPNTTWDGDGGGFCVSNANVEEYAIITDNGYLYKINQVLEPLETIHDELEASEDYSLFLALYDRFSNFEYDEDLSADYGDGEDLYLFYHSDLPKIASEWSYNGESSYPDYADLAQLSKVANNLFAPSNSALTQFYNEFWSDYYSSITDVNFLPIKYLLDNHVYEGDIVFPEEIENNEITSTYGNAITFNTDEVTDRKICANGTFYGLNSLTVPKMFESITAPLFQNPDYRMFLHMMDATSLVQSLMSENIDAEFFMASDSILTNNTTVDGKVMQYQITNPKKYGEQYLMIEGEDEPWVEMGVTTQEGIVRNHVAIKEMTAIDNYRVLKTMVSYQYLLVEDDDKVYSSHIYNNYPENPAIFALNSERYNGNTYDIVSDSAIALVQDYSLFKEQISKNPPEDMNYFKESIVAAQFSTTTPPFSFMQGERFIAFVPNDQAIVNNFANIPWSPASATAEFFKYFFVRVGASGLSDYPFPGAGIQGELTTFKTTDSGYAKLKLIDEGDQLRVVDAVGDTVNVLGVFPRIYNDGAAYLIDGILKTE